MLNLSVAPEVTSLQEAEATVRCVFYIYLHFFGMDNITFKSTPRSNPPGDSFALPQYIAAQLASASTEHLPSIVVTALPYVPQFGSHFGLNLMTKQMVKVCEALAVGHCNAVLHVPITRQWPHEEVASPGSRLLLTENPILWGYYVVGEEAEVVPIVKSRRRPRDEWALDDLTILMPIRFAKYSEGKLGPWTYRFVQRRELALVG